MRYHNRGGILDCGSNGGLWQISSHPVSCCIKDAPKIYSVASEFCIHPLFQEHSKKCPSTATLSHNFLTNCSTLSHNLYQKRTPYCIIFTIKGRPIERCIPSNQVWEYPPPPISRKKYSINQSH